MGNSGINAQHGFLYQRKVLYAFKNAHTNQLFTFESKDDIDIDYQEMEI